ncbi:MAG: DUF502 domain-containing protein [Anaerohalosphaeraceae bacterium]|nr:DUF502 domain-containing protein [Anaerohalosphaeraceae bacterium]
MKPLRNFKNYFLRGLAALLPTILTVWLFVQLYLFLHTHVSSHINRGVVRALVYSSSYYPHISHEEVVAYAKSANPGLIGQEIQIINEAASDSDMIRQARIAKAGKFWVRGKGQIAGFLIAFVAVIFVGAFLASFLGRAMWKMFERAVTGLPIIKRIYPNIKQVTDFFFARKQMSFSKVVAVEYPRKGCWSIAMVTGAGLKKITEGSKKEYLTVFVPTSPTPFTGYVIVLPKKETVELGMTIEEALRFTISGGVIMPEEFKNYEAQKQESLPDN